VTVAAGGAAIQTLDLGGPSFEIVRGDHRLVVDDAVRMCDSAEVRLVSPACARWSVTDGTGGAWFPEGVPHKWDVHDRPYFHADDVTLTVPAVPLTVRCTRGLEFGVVDRQVEPGTTVEADPPRLIDPAASGWYGGDLHVHLNYSGDLVCAPQEAARMQRGEGLHLMNLVAGNFIGSRMRRPARHRLLGRAMYCDAYTDAGGPPNFARFTFLGSAARRFYPDWEVAADMTVANLRTAAGKDPHDKALHDLVGELSTRSDEFRRRWGAHNVRTHGAGVKNFHHRIVGDLTLAYESLDLRAEAGLTVTIYTAEPGSPTEQALHLLASWAASEEAVAGSTTFSAERPRTS
jgi:hypothetical protein